MSETVFAAGAAVAGVPVVVDADRFELLVNSRQAAYYDVRDLTRAIGAVRAGDEEESRKGAAWPGCGCAERCGPCGPLELVTRERGDRAVIARSGLYA